MSEVVDVLKNFREKLNPAKRSNKPILCSKNILNNQASTGFDLSPYFNRLLPYYYMQYYQSHYYRLQVRMLPSSLRSFFFKISNVMKVTTFFSVMNKNFYTNHEGYPILFHV